MKKSNYKTAFTLAEVFAEQSIRIAFTLAEVLITLGIIGVVAALTMPSLIAKHQEKQTVVKLKKVYNIVSNAVLMAQSESGELVWQWGYTDDRNENSKLVGQKLKPYLNITEDCGNGDESECGLGNTDGTFSVLKGFIHSTDNFYQPSFYKFKLNDGSVIALRTGGSDEFRSLTPSDDFIGVFVDINSSSKPNTMGKDIFHFVISGNGKVLPSGVGKDPSDKSTFAYCNPSREGWFCTAWVVFKENMDYLHCADELHWNGKSKCN